MFDRVVDDLPAAHLFTEIRERDATRLIDDGNDQRVRVLTGTLVTTYEYPLAGSMEIGLGGGAAPRKEGQWFHALGPVAVVVHSKVVLPLQASSDAPALLAGLEEEGVDNTLAVANSPDFGFSAPTARCSAHGVPFLRDFRASPTTSSPQRSCTPGQDAGTRIPACTGAGT